MSENPPPLRGIRRLVLPDLFRIHVTNPSKIIGSASNAIFLRNWNESCYHRNDIAHLVTEWICNRGAAPVRTPISPRVLVESASPALSRSPCVGTARGLRPNRGERLTSGVNRVVGRPRNTRDSLTPCWPLLAPLTPLPNRPRNEVPRLRCAAFSIAYGRIVPPAVMVARRRHSPWGQSKRIRSAACPASSARGGIPSSARGRALAMSMASCKGTSPTPKT